MSYNLARFDLVSIRLAVACAQTGSLTAAARDSHLALAAASRRIRELESALGEALFERHARGLLPTPAGRVFLKHGLTLLQTMEQLGGELADLRQGIARHIRLCASSAAISQFLPPLLARYAELNAQVRVDLDEQVSDGAVAMLREGRADVAVFVEGPDTSGLATQLFRQDELNLETAVGRARVGRDAVRWQDVTTLRALAREAEQRGQRAAARLNRVRSARTPEVRVVMATNLSVHAASQVEESGQLPFLG